MDMLSLSHTYLCTSIGNQTARLVFLGHSLQGSHDRVTLHTLIFQNLNFFIRNLGENNGKSVKFFNERYIVGR